MTPAGLLGTLSDWYERNQDKLVGTGLRGAATRGLLGMDPPKDATKAEMEAYRNTANASMALAAGPVAATRAMKGVRRSEVIQDALEKKYPDVKISLSGDQEVYLGKIVVPKEMRGSGVGTKVMDDLVRQADQLGSRVTLTPSSDFGGSVGRLKDFYKRFGFVENKGKNKDFTISESMYREPKVLSGPVYPQAQAMETARQNAVKMLGLPENNTAMDRAKALGFEDGWYHGTHNDVPAFDIARVKERFPYSIGIHATNRPSEASVYAQKSPADKSTIVDGANVMPLMVRRGNSMDIDTKQVAASMEADINRAQIINDLVKAKNSGKPYDSVVISRRRGDEWDGANFITREPSRIRSRFAAFDPARIDDKDLLATLAALGITLPLTMGLLSDQTD